VAPSAYLESKTESAEGIAVEWDMSPRRGVAVPEDKFWTVLGGSKVEVEAESSEFRGEDPFVKFEEGAKDVDKGIFGSDPGPT
jgi:hypothetical protein